MRRPLLLNLISLLLIGISSTSCMAGGQPGPVAQKGVLDLRKLDLSDGPVALDGEWGFFWRQLLGPDQLPAAGTPAYLPFPSLWKDLRLNGKPLTSQGYATYTLTILLPKKRPRIGMEVPDVYCTYKLFV